MSSQYTGIISAYGLVSLAVFALWWAKTRFLCLELVAVKRPWLELALLGAAVASIILIGRAWSLGLMFPHKNVALECVNQFLIFSPILVVQAVLPNPLPTAGLPPKGAPGLLLGALLAMISLAAYLFVQGGLSDYRDLVVFIFHADHSSDALQVLLEDVAIASILFRIAAFGGIRVAAVIVAALFAAAHIPAMLAVGVNPSGMESLLLNTLIGSAILSAVLVTRSIWWLFPVHFVLDMTQLFHPHAH
jgi:hypothetical protein